MPFALCSLPYALCAYHCSTLIASTGCIRAATSAGYSTPSKLSRHPTAVAKNRDRAMSDPETDFNATVP